MITDVFMYFKFLVPISVVFSVLAPESTNAVRFGKIWGEFPPGSIFCLSAWSLILFGKLMLGSCFHAIYGPFIFSLLPDLFDTFIFGVFECNIGFELYSVIHLIVTLVIFVNYSLCNFLSFFGGRDTIDVSQRLRHSWGRMNHRIQRRIYVIIGLLRLCET